MSTKKRFNIMDAVIVLAVVAVIAAVILVMGINPKTTAGGTKTVVLEVKEKTEEFCLIPQEGDIILDAATKEEIGKVVGKRTEEAEIILTSAEEGKAVKSKIPDRYSLYLTLELHTGLDKAKIGKSMYIQGHTYACSGYVVEVVEPKEETK